WNATRRKRRTGTAEINRNLILSLLCFRRIIYRRPRQERTSPHEVATVHRTILIALALTAPYAAMAQEREPAVVEGAVINVQNSRTIPRASVSLIGMNGSGSQATRADGNGHFIFASVQPGKYRLKAERQGFFSDERKRDYQPVFAVASGEHLKVGVPLIPMAVVSGEIVDEYNDFLQNVELKLLASRRRLGQMYLTTAGTATTDDRGQY